MKIEKIYVELGQRIRAGRLRAGLTQVQFAKRMKISRPALVNIELGRQRVMLHSIGKFAKFIHITPSQLVRGLWQ